MKKVMIIIITFISIGLFVLLVYYGLRHSRGTPVEIEVSKKTTMEIPFKDNQIDLSEGISSAIWEELNGHEIELMYQVMVLPWGNSLVSPVTVKAFHNNEDIYFYMSWKDETRDSSKKINKFQDACGIMFPIEKKEQPSTIMMGFMGKANIWQWKANQNEEYWFNKGPELKTYADFHYPFEDKELFPVSKVPPESAVNDLLAIRIGTITHKKEQAVHGRGIWENGLWHVVFKRSLRVASIEEDVVFDPGVEKMLSAFAVWNGSTKDRGGRKSISGWIELELTK